MLPSYFHEIGKIPLLTAEEEVALAARIQAGCEEARNRMIAANLRLVAKIAGDFVNLGVPLDDLISEGNLGLIKAVERFRADKGVRFATYASWWIRQNIHRALGGQGYAIRLTPGAMGKLAKLRRVAYGMLANLGREPTDDELADELGMDAASLGRLKSVASRPSSMEALIGDEGSSTLGSLLVDEAAEDPLASLSGKDLRVEADGLMTVLKSRERAVIARRFGFDGYQSMTLEVISTELGCTRERVRQIQDDALKRMRRASSRRQALQFLQATPPPAAHAVPLLSGHCAA
jgi:RNA polymerase primary sigma factor